MIKNRIFNINIRRLNSCKMSSSLYEIKPQSKKNYKKKELFINNKKIIISVPENISKELDSILKKYYNSYNK
jgi:hypothetical protein